MCESAPSFHYRGIILWCNLYNVSDNGGNNYVGEYSGFLLAVSRFRKLCAADAIMFSLFPDVCPVVQISHPSPLDSSGGLLGLEQSLHKVQGHWARQRREIDSSHRLFWLVSVGIS